MGAAVLDDPRARHDWQVVECGGRAREGGCRRMGRALGGRMRGWTDVVEENKGVIACLCASVGRGAQGWGDEMGLHDQDRDVAARRS